MTTTESLSAFAEPFTGVFDWGITVIETLQRILPAFLEPVFIFFTFLGEPVSYLIIIAVWFWCIDERHAGRCGIILFVSAGINTAVKETLAIPRPFLRKPGLNRIAETGFSTPSGHSQNSAAFWPVFLKPVANRKARIAASLAIPFVIGLSRVYLGVHYPTDVFLGWTLGAFISLASLFALPLLARTAFPALQARFPGSKNLPISVKVAAVAAGSFLLNTFSHGDTRMSGVLFGFSTGYLLLVSAAENDRFSAASGTIAKKVLRFMVGFAGIGILYGAGETACHFAGTANLALCHFVQYALAGFWISRLAPALFVRTGLQ